jgi:hypothetical protein
MTNSSGKGVNHSVGSLRSGSSNRRSTVERMLCQPRIRKRPKRSDKIPIGGGNGNKVFAIKRSVWGDQDVGSESGKVPDTSEDVSNCFL